VRRFEHKVALITGAASGIGRATAEALASEGAKLALADICVDALHAVAGVENLPIHCDVSQPAAAREIVAQTLDRFGRLDILVNVAGIDLHARLEETTEADWDRIMAVNLTSVFLLSKYSVPELARNRGVIVNIASAAALFPIAEHPAYNASKAAVVGLTKSLALDLATRGIRVNCICPGAVETPLLRQSFDAAPDPVAARVAVVARYPLGRLGTAQEIARTIAFLASDEASFITGAALAVDGGRTMH
jgi:NAD(P)-dependent dehydrogenase (short-subunit alcohol dehydrogenase family)